MKLENSGAEVPMAKLEPGNCPRVLAFVICRGSRMLPTLCPERAGPKFVADADVANGLKPVVDPNVKPSPVVAPGPVVWPNPAVTPVP